VDLTRTRTSLHGIAELLLAGPQYAASGTIRLRVVADGFATVAEPDLRVEGAELVGPLGRHPMSGRYIDVAAALGVTARRLDDVYRGGTTLRPEDVIEVDAPARAFLLDTISVGDAALRSFAPQEQPVLWPEHFDVAISVDEVNYGLSPGDASLAEPYAYVGPWRPRSGDFWNQPYGAARPLSSLGGPRGVEAFFREGAERAAGTPA
jgi:hypothetical protein